MFKTFVTFVALGQMCIGAYAAMDATDASLFSTLFMLGVLWLAGEFCKREFAAAYGTGLVDAGFLFGWSWPLAVPYFLLRCRGARRGFAAIGLLLLAFAVPYMVGFALASVGSALL